MKTSSAINIPLALVLIVLGCGSRIDESAEFKEDQMQKERRDWVIVIHGGAGSIRKGLYSEEEEDRIRSILDSALQIGSEILDGGGNSLDAVTETVVFLENSPYFNAGKGAVFTHEGKNELDASIMRGSDLQAGAVAGVTRIKNPVRAARAVLEKSEHVFLSGEGANEFARMQGLEMVDPDYFFTRSRYESLQRKLEKEKADKHGTVGAVALDRNGDLAAATSTGGMTNKKFNRIGDSPIIGAGTYADNRSCAVSCTGHGEYFIRYAVAHDLAARIQYTGLSLIEAANEIIMEELKGIDADGGLIAVDRYGNYSMPFNTSGMFRGVSYPGHSETGLY